MLIGARLAIVIILCRCKTPQVFAVGGRAWCAALVPAHQLGRAGVAAEDGPLAACPGGAPRHPSPHFLLQQTRRDVSITRFKYASGNRNDNESAGSGWDGVHLLLARGSPPSPPKINKNVKLAPSLRKGSSKAQVQQRQPGEGGEKGGHCAPTLILACHSAAARPQPCFGTVWGALLGRRETTRQTLRYCREKDTLPPVMLKRKPNFPLKQPSDGKVTTDPN